MELANTNTRKLLLDTAFKGLNEISMKKAIMEGMIRGFDFKNFLVKDVYAIPFGQGYSLVTSIDYARKIGAKSGICGIEEPVYEMEGDTIVSCSVTVKKIVGSIVGDFTAKVYFKEYTTGKNLWTSKPKTMIAKVAEVHALRKACPEELSQTYVEEEMVKEQEKKETPVFVIDEYEKSLKGAKDLKELSDIWVQIPAQGKPSLEGLKNELKAKFIDNLDNKNENN